MLRLPVCVFAIALVACSGQASSVPPAASAASRTPITCSLPAAADPAVVSQLYAKWKADLLTSDGAGGFVRVRRPNSGTQLNSSNSEGIGYGMLLAVYLDDPATFDGLWQYEQLHLGANGLMEWEIGPGGDVIGSGAATDGDEDMAFALVMADARWHGRGTLARSYHDDALEQLDRISRSEIDHTRGDMLMPGDQFDGAKVINLSYFAPAFYRVFGDVSGHAAEWQRVIDTGYTALAAALNASNRNLTTGLVPAWSTPEGVPTVPPGTQHPTHHQLDSCRTPFRIAQDYCWFGEPRARAYLDVINAFYARVGVRSLVDGYNLDGSVFPGAKLHLAAFVAGAGAAAMSGSRFAAPRDEAYAELTAWDGVVGGSQYYNESWAVLGALMLTGRFTNLHAPR